MLPDDRDLTDPVWKIEIAARRWLKRDRDQYFLVKLVNLIVLVKTVLVTVTVTAVVVTVT